jgi:hypothetical protein
MRSWGFALVALALGACGDDSNVAVDAPGSDPDAAVDAPIDAPPPPMTLLDTGLCMDAACTTIDPANKEYGVRFPLYSDGALKRRWIYLPPGTTIDTTDMNHWKFPVGTKVWKEFSVGATRVETRYITKTLADDTAPGAWFYASYEWNGAQTATTLASPQAGVPNANGTTHDIPSRANCRRCHEQVPGRVLGLGAIQSDYSAPAGSLDLADMISQNLLSTPPAAPSVAGDPYFPWPAAATAIDKAAFGYLHGNCGGCHNPTSAVFSGIASNMNLRLDVTKMGTLAMIPARATTLNVNGTVSGLTGPIVAVPGGSGSSVMITRMSSLMFPIKMPEIGTETTDPDGLAAVSAWIDQPP